MDIDTLIKHVQVVNDEFEEINKKLSNGRTIELVTEKARIVGKLEMLSILIKEL